MLSMWRFWCFVQVLPCLLALCTINLSKIVWCISFSQIQNLMIVNEWSHSQAEFEESDQKGPEIEEARVVIKEVEQLFNATEDDWLIIYVGLFLVTSGRETSAIQNILALFFFFCWYWFNLLFLSLSSLYY